MKRTSVFRLYPPLNFCALRNLITPAVSISRQRLGRRRTGPDDLDQDCADDAGGPTDLEQAEKDVAELNLEEKLIETHQLVETFNTMHGFDTNYIEQLVRELSDIGVDATYLFKHTMPTGTMSYTGHSGIFELFVNKEAVEKAQAYIKDKLAMKSH